jgi:hypothetical protein
MKYLCVYMIGNARCISRPLSPQLNLAFFKGVKFHLRSLKDHDRRSYPTSL